MDEIQFLEVRPRSGLDSRSRTPAAQVQRSLTPYPTGFNAPIDLTGEDDDVVHLDTRARHDAGVNTARPIGVGLGTIAVEDDDGEFGFGGLLDRNPRLRLRLGQAGGIRAQHDRLMELTHERHRHMGTNNVNGQRNDNQPLRLAVPAAVARFTVDMNYDMPGFDMGYPGAVQAQPPKYEAPEPAKEGFTRSPEEDEEVVCPNCGDELAMGDTEDKQQIWVVKKCGHAYCGDCAKNRPKRATRSTKNGKGKAPADNGPFPFKHCVVDGCKESALLKSMIRLYMAS
ncbi:Hypothetical predicted protein [Lecanosticta acicola]|uniref:Uncharacterized protein n=1 Tax=Lecanosticta acicola TaxID=111012 RepID=A0AAI9E872_9PEZI|nr:Hypothetical predicted protein [Lecanosticta acicola]